MQMSFVKVGGNDYLVLVAPHLPLLASTRFHGIVRALPRFGFEALVAVPCDISACLLVLFCQNHLL